MGRNAKSKLPQKSNTTKVMRVALMLISLIIVGGCVASQHSVVADVDVEQWGGDVKCVVMDNYDTTTLRDVNLFVRYIPSMVGDSLTLTINTMSPDSITFSEEVKLYFDTSPTARSVSRREVFAYRANVVLSKLGSYRFEFTPTTPISGVEAIGVNVIKSTK